METQPHHKTERAPIGADTVDITPATRALLFALRKEALRSLKSGRITERGAHIILGLAKLIEEQALDLISTKTANA